MGIQSSATHIRTALAQWAFELLQHSATHQVGTRLWNAYDRLPQCMGPVASGCPATRIHSAALQWPKELLVHYPLGTGQWNTCNALRHSQGKWASEIMRHTAPMPRDSGKGNSSATPPYRPVAMGNGAHAMHRRTALGRWAAEFLQNTTSPPGALGIRTLAETLPHCLVGVGIEDFAMHGRTA